MADIITRLLLKTNDFDANLNKAKSSFNDFQGSIANMAQTAGAGVMKFAGTLGIAVGAYEGLNKVISSSQTLSDEYNRTIDGLKGGIDEFFYSIGSGDWTPFFNGLDETIRKAREAYNAMDQLGNTKMSYGYINARNQADLQKQITILRDKNSTDAQKKAAKEALGNILKDQKEATERLKLESSKTMQALVAQGTGLNVPDVSLMSIDKTIRYDARAIGDKEKAQRAKEYAEFEAEAERIRKKYTKIEMIQVGGGMAKSMIPHEIVDNEKVNKEMAPVLAKYQDAINYNTILVKRSDEWLQNLIRIDNEAFNAERAYESMVKAANRASQSTTGGTKPPKDTPPPVGSLAALDAEITKQNKKLAEATTMQARAAVQATINELEQQKINLKVVVDQEAFKIKHGEMKGNKADDAGYSEQHTMFSDMLAERESALSKATDEQTKTFIQSQIDKLRETINGLNRARYELETPGNIDAKSMPKNVDYETLRGYSNKIEEMKAALSEDVSERTKASIQAEINKLETAARALAKVEGGTPGSIYEALQNNAGNKKQGSFDLRKELPNMKLPKFKSPIKKADISLNEEYADSLNSIGSIMGSLSGTFDGGAASVLQWGASILSTIAQVIPQLNSLTEANEIETTSEVKGAVGKTMNAHAKIPFVGIAMGLAGVASIFSVMSQAGKFATGGIVPGNSFTGDKVPAWVNSGEMILNSEQQSNLFKMLNSKLYGGLNIGRPNIEPQMGNIAALIAPGGDNQKIELAGNIRIKAQELELILKNRERITGRIR